MLGWARPRYPRVAFARWLDVARISILGHTGLQGWHANSLLDWLKQVSPVAASTIGLLLVQSPRASGRTANAVCILIRSLVPDVNSLSTKAQGRFLMGYPCLGVVQHNQK
jgi:hypothetical protein